MVEPKSKILTPPQKKHININGKRSMYMCVEKNENYLVYNKKTRMYPIRLSEIEMKYLNEKAAEKNLKVSQYIRAVLFKELYYGKED